MDSFVKDGLIPAEGGDAAGHMLDSVPLAQLKITYSSVGEVNPGKVLTPTQVKDPPCLEWTADADAFYTLIMNDPDAPSRKEPKFGEWHHWLLTNIPGCNVASGDVMSEYVGSGPPKDTGLHRYVFLVFKQQGKQTFEGLQKLTNRAMDGRPMWKVRDFAKKYNLGQPVAGNFFQAEYDDYVPKLYEQLSGKL